MHGPVISRLAIQQLVHGPAKFGIKPLTSCIPLGARAPLFDAADAENRDDAVWFIDVHRNFICSNMMPEGCELLRQFTVARL